MRALSSLLLSLSSPARRSPSRAVADLAPTPSPVYPMQLVDGPFLPINLHRLPTTKGRGRTFGIRR